MNSCLHSDYVGSSAILLPLAGIGLNCVVYSYPETFVCVCDFQLIHGPANLSHTHVDVLINDHFETLFVLVVVTATVDNSHLFNES